MKRILDKITPSFIKTINENLLKNSILGWQLQLPRILWLWFLISLISIPIAFLHPINLVSNNDIETMVGISIFLAVLQFFLYGYILIQFNASKAFGKRTFLYGMKEQLGYFLAMFLCLTNVILLPFIVESRKAEAISIETIKKETEIYNKARHYFMDDQGNYRYFPNKEYFLDYEFSFLGENVSQGDYYVHTIEPLLKPYFSNDRYFNKIDSKYTRKVKGPQLYYTGEDYLYHDELTTNASDYDDIKRKNRSYQFEKKNDSERLNDIKKFIALYKKYEKINNKHSSYYRNENAEFKEAKAILDKYKSNQFKICVTSESDYSSSEVRNQLSNWVIENIHSSVLDAREYKWIHAGWISFACFFVALAFSLLAFVFKNVRLKEFILSFVYAGIIALATIILMILIRKEELIGLHILILLFFTGIITLISAYRWKYFSSFKLVLIIFTNATFALVPIFLFFYFYDYLRMGRLDYAYCNLNPDICQERYDLIEKLRWICLWGGVLIYFVAGSTLYKKVYEKIYALPLHK